MYVCMYVSNSAVTFVTRKCFALRLLPPALLRKLAFIPEYVVIFSMAFLKEGLLSEVWLL